MITKSKEIYMIENESGMSFSVQKVKNAVREYGDGKREYEDGKREYEEQIVFLIEDIDPDMDLHGRDLVLTLSKEEAEKLAGALTGLITEGVFRDRPVEDFETLKTLRVLGNLKTNL
ncbi:MAG: hypothetical protein LBL57_04085 [Tannerella sp.]|jgi:hypothetical protein|nr:hypothetical protein [Tannerella sp.]